MKYKPTGGIERCLLSTAKAVGADEEFSVELIDDSSHYTQSIKADNNAIIVDHTLTLVARADKAADWLSSSFLEWALYEGLQATVLLNCQQLLSLGTLKLLSLDVSTAQSLTEQPTVTLKLHRQDTNVIPLNYE